MKGRVSICKYLLCKELLNFRRSIIRRCNMEKEKTLSLQELFQLQMFPQFLSLSLSCSSFEIGKSGGFIAFWSRCCVSILLFINSDISFLSWYLCEFISFLFYTAWFLTFNLINCFLKSSLTSLFCLVISFSVISFFVMALLGKNVVS